VNVKGFCWISEKTFLFYRPRRAKKHTTDGKLDESLDMILKEAVRIDEVIAA